MGCKEFREKISAYMDKELDAAVSRSVARHIETCAICREDLRGFERVDLLVRGMPAVHPGADFTGRVVARAEQWDALTGKQVRDRTIHSALMQFMEAFFDLWERRRDPDTRTLDEFGDFPPLSMSCVYFRILGQTGGRG